MLDMPVVVVYNKGAVVATCVMHVFLNRGNEVRNEKLRHARLIRGWSVKVASRKIAELRAYVKRWDD
ncbi:MAG: hypothetical protein NVS4B11_02430 [Ktedonobacteraceae bacterium]